MRSQIMTVCLLAAAPAACAKPPVTGGETDPVLKDLTPVLVEMLGGGPEDKGGPLGPDASLVDLMNLPRFQALVKRHELRLFTGPMLGAVTPHAARFWVRTPGAAKIRVIVGRDRQLASPVRSADPSGHPPTRRDDDRPGERDALDPSPSRCFGDPPRCACAAAPAAGSGFLS